MSNPKKIVVSVHDITPRFHDECAEIFRTLDKLNVSQRSLLITPNFAGKFPIDKDEKFISMMKNEKETGAELALHGLVHQNFEFYKKNYAEAKLSLQTGIKLFENAFGFAPKGFVAPQWLESKGALKAVQELGFSYAGVLRKIIYFESGAQFKTFPLNFDWGNSLLDHTIALINKAVASFRKSGLIRFAVHPMDIPNGVFEKEMDLLSNLLKKNWTPVSYENLNGEKSNE